MKERIEKLYRLISMLTVSGDNVDVIAAVRQELKSIYKELEANDETTDTSV